MSHPNPPKHIWQVEFERQLLGLIAIGGVVIGLGIILLSPTGAEGTDFRAIVALAIGIGAATNLLLNRTDPVPVLVLIVLLVGGAAPFVDLPMAMALGAVLVGVVATGAIVIERTEGAVALIGLGLAALVLRPTLELLGHLPAGTEPATAPWLVALVALLLTGVGFRSLRDQLVRKDIHQSRINELVENSAYQIKTPLTAAIGYAYLLRAEVGEGLASDYADGVIRRGWEVSLGLDDLMIVSRADTDDLDVLEQPVDVAGAVEECLDHLIGARAKTTHLDVKGSVLGDPVRVRHVVRHLVNNAVLHGGAEISIIGTAKGRMYELRIHDTGEPLDAGQQALIFEPFQRLEGSEMKAGRGVGLTVSRILAVAMGGDLRFESGPAGNTVVLTLRTAPGPRVVDTVTVPGLASPQST